jgi:hypothetical protein
VQSLPQDSKIIIMKIKIEIETENKAELIEAIEKIINEIAKAPDDFFTRKATYKEDTKHPRFEIEIVEPI